MAIGVAEYRSEHEPLVRAFNDRMRVGGSSWGFYDKATPGWLPPTPGATTRRDFYVAVDETSAVRGAYCLKHQQFLIRGEIHEIASIQGPVSEGVVDQRFGAVALHLIRDMQQRESKLFAWGASDRLFGVLQRMRWLSIGTPLAIKVINGNRFLRRNRFLRTSRILRSGSDVLAGLGLGSAAFRFVQFGQQLRAGGAALTSVSAVEEPRFGPWADEIWAKARSEYDFIAIRDHQSMNLLLPEAAWPEATILKIEKAGAAIGWAAVRDTQLQDSPRFGNLRLGSVIDALALPGHEQAVLGAASKYLERRRVDVIAANFASPVWISAFKRCGFLVSSNKRLLIVSPALASLLESEGGAMRRLHLTPLDGDGPLGL